MKGIVFTEFLEMVEGRFGPELADRILDGLPSGGSYTAVGTYDHKELVELVARLSAATATPMPELLRGFGSHLFGRFVVLYPQFFRGVDSAFSFLMSIESRIHAEVRKLYPDAELPRFDCTRAGLHLEVVYRSSRSFGDLAEGLILGCVAYFGEEIDIRRDSLAAEHGQAVRFLLTRRPGAREWTTTSTS